MQKLIPQNKNYSFVSLKKILSNKKIVQTLIFIFSLLVVFTAFLLFSTKNNSVNKLNVLNNINNNNNSVQLSNYEIEIIYKQSDKSNQTNNSYIENNIKVFKYNSENNSLFNTSTNEICNTTNSTITSNISLSTNNTLTHNQSSITLTKTKQISKKIKTNILLRISKLEIIINKNWLNLKQKLKKLKKRYNSNKSIKKSQKIILLEDLYFFKCPVLHLNQVNILKYFKYKKDHLFIINTKYSDNIVINQNNNCLKSKLGSIPLKASKFTPKTISINNIQAKNINTVTISMFFYTVKFNKINLHKIDSKQIKQEIIYKNKKYSISFTFNEKINIKQAIWIEISHATNFCFDNITYTRG